MTMQAGSRVAIHDDLLCFFRDRVDEAAAHQRAGVSPSARHYLAQLLTDVGHDDEPTPQPGETLAELHVQASLAPPGTAVTLLKRLGDCSLLLTGYFREQLTRRHVSRAYCARMGETAYERLNAMFPEDTALVFGELARRYEACAEVIAEVRDEAAARSDTDALRLYEEWLRTGSPRVAERLRALGLVPVRSGGVG